MGTRIEGLWYELQLTKLRKGLEDAYQQIINDINFTTNQSPCELGLAPLYRRFNGLKKEYDDLLLQNAAKKTNDPLKRLPMEIWVRILSDVVRGEIGGLLPLMTVSKYWSREISSPVARILWSTIYVDSSDMSAEALEFYCVLSLGLPLKLTVYWPLAKTDPVWTKLSTATSRCNRLDFSAREEVGNITYSNGEFKDFMDAFPWPHLHILNFSPQFDAKAGGYMNRLATNSLRSFGGVSQDVHHSMIGYKYPAARRSVAWKGEKMVVKTFNCIVRNFTAISSSEVQEYDEERLVSGSQTAPPPRKGRAGPPEPFTSLIYLPTYLHIKSLALHEGAPSWWFYIQYNCLQTLRLAIDATQIGCAVTLLETSPRLSEIKITLICDNVSPQIVDSIPHFTDLGTLHLEIGTRQSSLSGDLKSNDQLLYEWLVHLLHKFVETHPPIRRLTFRAVGVPLNANASKELVRAFNETPTLVELTLSTIMSFNGMADVLIILPALEYLTTRDNNILEHLQAPQLAVIETIALRGEERVVEFPSRTPPSIRTLRYGINCYPGRSWGGIFNSLEIVEFLKQDTTSQETWPSHKFDEFCEVLMDKGVCPRLHTLGSSIFPSWNGLLRLLSSRNIVDKTQIPIKCIRLPAIPNYKVLVPLVALLRGLFPLHIPDYGAIIERYHDENLPGCINCLVGGWNCNSRATKRKDGDVSASAEIMDSVGSEHVDNPLFIESGVWKNYKAQREQKIRAAMKNVKRVVACSRYRTAGKWLPLTSITVDSMDFDTLESLQTCSHLE